MRQIAVVGLGKFGSAVAKQLVEEGAQVIAIDENKDLVEGLKDHVTYAVALDATDENALKAVGVQNVDIAVVCIGDDVEANLLATLLLKKLGVKKIWARAISPLQQEILKALEVDAILNLEEEMGELVARSLVMENVAKHLHLSPGLSLVELKVPEQFVGKTLRQLSPRTAYGVNIVAIKHRKPQISELGERTFEEHVDYMPSADAGLELTDVLVVVGNDTNIAKFSKA